MTKNLFVVLAACALAASAALGWHAPGAPQAQANAQADATYVGADACKKCHFTQHRGWSDELHAKAWENLPEKFRSPDATTPDGRQCISCHVTGWGQEGGFVSAEETPELLAVGCEACHGAGSKHVEKTGEMLKAKQKEFAEGEPTFITLRTTNCANCHNPHIDFAAFAK